MSVEHVNVDRNRVEVKCFFRGRIQTGRFMAFPYRGVLAVGRIRILRFPY